jgi:hypothetical protein
MIQDFHTRADKCAINPPDNIGRGAKARVVGVSTFHTNYPKEAL